MTHARIYLFALAVLGLAVGGIAASSTSRQPVSPVAPIVEPQPTAEHCPLDAPAAGSLVAAGTAPNSSCPPPKVCCGWKDPGHHICNRCC